MIKGGKWPLPLASVIAMVNHPLYTVFLADTLGDHS